MTNQLRKASALYRTDPWSATKAIGGLLAWRLADRRINRAQPGLVRKVRLPGFAGSMRLFSGELTVYEHVVVGDYYEFSDEAHVQPDWRIVEVGAHVGFYSVSRGARLDPALGGRLLALEADPVTFALLAQNVASVPAATAVQRAVFSEAGVLEFLSARRSEAAHIAGFGNTRGPNQNRPGEVVRVPSVTLDEATADFDRIDLLKINAEGAEMQIIDGGQGRALPRTSRVLLSHEGVEPLSEVADRLAEFDLHLHSDNGDQLYLFTRGGRDQS